jgi:hypothetical protein
MHIKWSNARYTKYLMLFALILALIATSLSVAAQDNVTPFTTADNSLTVVVPDGWTVEEIGPGSIAMVTDDAYVGITLFPTNMLADVGLPLGNSAEETLQFIFESELFVPQQDDTEVGEIQPLELANTVSAAQFSIATSSNEGVLIAAIHSDAVVAYISVVVPSGEYNNFEENVRNITESITVSVTADELIALIMS